MDYVNEHVNDHSKLKSTVFLLLCVFQSNKTAPFCSKYSKVLN